MTKFIIDVDQKTLKVEEKRTKFNYPIYQVAFDENVFYILFKPESDNKNWGRFENLWGMNKEGEVIWKAELPDVGCFYRINLIEGKLHAYISTFDCVIDPNNGKIVSSEFYK